MSAVKSRVVVTVVPITHTPPSDPADALEEPRNLKHTAWRSFMVELNGLYLQERQTAQIMGRKKTIRSNKVNIKPPNGET